MLRNGLLKKVFISWSTVDTGHIFSSTILRFCFYFCFQKIKVIQNEEQDQEFSEVKGLHYISQISSERRNNRDWTFLCSKLFVIGKGLKEHFFWPSPQGLGQLWLFWTDSNWLAPIMF